MRQYGRNPVKCYKNIRRKSRIKWVHRMRVQRDAILQTKNKGRKFYLLKEFIGNYRHIYVNLGAYSNIKVNMRNGYEFSFYGGSEPDLYDGMAIECYKYLVLGERED